MFDDKWECPDCGFVNAKSPLRNIYEKNITNGVETFGNENCSSCHKGFKTSLVYGGHFDLNKSPKAPPIPTTSNDYEDIEMEMVFSPSTLNPPNFTHETEEINKKINEKYNLYKLNPNSHSLSNELIHLYQDSKQWDKVIEILNLLSIKENSPSVKAKYLYTIASVYRRFLSKNEIAIEYYNLSLDYDSSNLKAFIELDKIVNEQKDWELQAYNFRCMIKRVMDNDPNNQILLLKLWQGLGEVYKFHLKDYEKAIMAFDVALGIDPKDDVIEKYLRELHSLV